MPYSRMARSPNLSLKEQELLANIESKEMLLQDYEASLGSLSEQMLAYQNEIQETQEAKHILETTVPAMTGEMTERDLFLTHRPSCGGSGNKAQMTSVETTSPH